MCFIKIHNFCVRKIRIKEIKVVMDIFAKVCFGQTLELFSQLFYHTMVYMYYIVS